MDFDREHDQRVRTAAFGWLASRVSDEDGVVSSDVMRRGFDYGGKRVSLMSQVGIFQPASMDFPISIMTSLKDPYKDKIGPDKLLRYKYQGTDPNNRFNRGLRGTMTHQLPLVYFRGLVTKRYSAIWPVYVVGDSPGNLEFSVTFEASTLIDSAFSLRDEGEPFGELRREYAAVEVPRRIHQRAFRERVLRAYEHRCAFCNLRHEQLLEAAHITPDSDPLGEPIVSNGMSLCRLHHVAFDRLFLGVNPDYVIHVRPDILYEIDGPMLKHGLQGLQGQRILAPSRRVERPDEGRLGERWERFLGVG